MDAKRQFPIRLAAAAIGIPIYYTIIMIACYLAAHAAIGHHIVLGVWPFKEFQRYDYFGVPGSIVEARSIWQQKPDCVELDDRLIYKPKNGACEFSNLEFSTKLTFDDLGRNLPARVHKSGSPGVAILGDSFAMGWGVNDGDTFANVVQSKITTPVFNLGVSSYGTLREIEYLMTTGLIDRVDTIVIQYCDNDLEENKVSIGDEKYTERKNDYDRILLGGAETNALFERFKPDIERAALKTRFFLALNEPFAKLGSMLKSDEEDFDGHYKALSLVLQKYQPKLADKNVIIFYLNSHNKRFKGFPTGSDKSFPNVFFTDIALPENDFFAIDDHITVDGHKHVGEQLVTLLTSRFGK